MEVDKIEDRLYECSPYVRATGFTQLMLCVLNNDLDTSSKYLKEINAKNSIGWTALHIACRNSKTFSSEEMVKFLLEKGADPNVKDNFNSVPLHSASAVSNEDSSLATVELLLKNGADPNVKGQFDWTPLHCASIFVTSSLETVKLLLQYNASPIDTKTQILKLEIDIESLVEENKRLQQKILLLENEED